MSDGTTTVTQYNSFRIRIDPDYTWWTSRDAIPQSGDYYDLWSVASHEIGHVTGIVKGDDHSDGSGHFRDDDEFRDAHTCPIPGEDNYLARETMCQIALPNRRVARNPSDHEKSLFEGAYRDPIPPMSLPPGGGGGGGGGSPVYQVCDVKVGEGVVMGAPGTEVAGSEVAIREGRC